MENRAKAEESECSCPIQHVQFSSAKQNSNTGLPERRDSRDTFPHGVRQENKKCEVAKLHANTFCRLPTLAAVAPTLTANKMLPFSC